METNFEEQLIELCGLLGSDKYTIINEIGEPDESTFDENGKQFLFYDTLDVVITIPQDFKVAELIWGPLKPKISKKLNGFYTFHGASIDDTRSDILSKWGEPTIRHPFVWCYSNKTGATNNGYHFEIRTLWNNENPNILLGFGGMLIDYGQQNVSNEKPKSGCFIATVCYENYDAPEVLILRQFRDNILLNSKMGKLAVNIYYFLSPPIASLISKSVKLKHFIRIFLLDPIVSKLSKKIF